MDLPTGHWFAQFISQIGTESVSVKIRGESGGERTHQFGVTHWDFPLGAGTNYSSFPPLHPFNLVGTGSHGRRRLLVLTCSFPRNGAPGRGLGASPGVCRTGASSLS